MDIEYRSTNDYKVFKHPFLQDTQRASLFFKAVISRVTMVPFSMRLFITKVANFAFGTHCWQFGDGKIFSPQHLSLQLI